MEPSASDVVKPSAGKIALALKRRASGTIEEFWRYFGVSVVALAVDFGLLVTLTELFGVHYLLSGGAAFLAGAGTAYIGSVRWAFAHRRLANPGREMALFALIGVGGLGVNEVMLWSLTDLLAFHYTVSKLGAAGAGFLFNFGARKYLLFR